MQNINSFVVHIVFFEYVQFEFVLLLYALPFIIFILDQVNGTSSASGNVSLNYPQSFSSPLHTTTLFTSYYCNN